LHTARIGIASERYSACSELFTKSVLRTMPEGGTMSDLIYIGLTIVVFGLLFLILKGVERFER
jgi:hypothetical protein